MSETLIHTLITAANQYDTETFVNLFTQDAVIDDVSVGEQFKRHAGINKYFVTYFIGYHTKTQVLSIEQKSSTELLVKVDFRGDFGHETGGLHLQINYAGLIDTSMLTWIKLTS